MSGYIRGQIRARNRARVLPKLASERLERLREKERARAKTIGRECCLLDYVPFVSPELERPDHLGPYAAILEVAVPWTKRKGSPQNDNAGGQCIVVAAPPQHGKTELTLRAFLWWAEHFPGKRHAYVTYNADRSEEVAQTFRMLAEQAGFEPTGNLKKIRLKGGTSIKFTSIGGSLTGSPIDGVCVIDDPIKGPAEARSPAVRKRCVDWFDSVAWTRRHPGTSFIVMATRWHPEDLSGVLIKRGWRYINLKAIAEGPVNDNGVVTTDPLGRRSGESLWPSRKPPEFFAVDRKNVYWWASLFQGEPRPASGTVFRAPPRFYTKLPIAGYRGAFGLDLAYTAKTSADWSICIEGVWYDGDVNFPRGLYIVDVLRKQVDAPSFALALKTKKSSRPGWKMRWYASGTEKGSAQFLTGAGIPVRVKPPIGDKFTRATAGKNPVCAAWNGIENPEGSGNFEGGLIFLPDPEANISIPGTERHVNTRWLPDLIDVVSNFTGIDDENDDDVDALAALWDEIQSGDVGGIVTF